MTEGLYINGEAVDLKPDAATTLNYKSNPVSYTHLTLPTT